MSKILTKIQAQKKAGRFNLFIDGKYSFSVSETVLVNNNLYKGQELSETLLSKLIDADQFSKIYQKALNYLSYQMRSEKEVTDYLKKEFSDILLIAEVVEKLKTNKLLDDTNFAMSYVRTMLNISDKGFTVIKKNLRAKGISEQNIEKAKVEYEQAEMTDKLELLLPKLIHQYRNYPKIIRIQKVKQRLISKGFVTEEFENLLTNIDFEDEEHETELLLDALDKLWNKFSKSQLSASQKKIKIKQTLYRKGFALDKINSALEKK
ncbi:recombination regulator RecX [Liquorilactobacillus cacaonum]|uniref:Regulatory protein RecX n=1 Tax=Liquorilactobacillus cacaonum DSM 21116 TaxID=1423729 RepID=A0A0R2CLD5_9LACO|nr:recombination regulator RecX [Liquorilactobacillus cacaonum]KRM91906.1 recombination regulator RecX [Liquorilactobacillus cacaonum DSM 21116]